jgi:hypothetical protein
LAVWTGFELIFLEDLAFDAEIAACAALVLATTAPRRANTVATACGSAAEVENGPARHSRRSTIMVVREAFFFHDGPRCLSRCAKTTATLKYPGQHKEP